MGSDAKTDTLPADTLAPAARVAVVDPRLSAAEVSPTAEMSPPAPPTADAVVDSVPDA